MLLSFSYITVLRYLAVIAIILRKTPVEPNNNNNNHSDENELYYIQLNVNTSFDLRFQTLFNPQGTVVKMFVVRYDLLDMPASSQTFVRQRTFFMPSNGTLNDARIHRSWLRYLIHLRYASFLILLPVSYFIKFLIITVVITFAPSAPISQFDERGKIRYLQGTTNQSPRFP